MGYKQDIAYAGGWALALYTWLSIIVCVASYVLFPSK
jgi:hypothetical protein